MVVEINNVKQQEQKRCKYCLGTGKTSKTTSEIYILGFKFLNGGIEPFWHFFFVPFLMEIVTAFNC